MDESRVFLPMHIAVATISDTRTAANDTSGSTLAARWAGWQAALICSHGPAAQAR
ncbi:hypothetical protein [Acidocella sp.]|uniref:hypothetical protein n=1 Tax=Acidocella sp. TaxID=50710 RepID=UPI0038D22FBC